MATVFRHKIYAHADTKLQKVIEQLGMDGYGSWWILVEHCAAKEKKGGYVEFTMLELSRIWGKHPKNVMKTLNIFASLQLISTPGFEKNLKLFEIRVNKLSKYKGKNSINDPLIAINEKKSKKLTPVKAQPGISHGLHILWNTVILEQGAQLPKAKAMNKKRTAQIKSCITQYKEMSTLEDWRRYFEKVMTTPFLTGNNNRGWRADFDWVINPSNLIRIVEGRYDNLGKKIDTMINPFKGANDDQGSNF